MVFKLGQSVKIKGNEYTWKIETIQTTESIFYAKQIRVTVSRYSKVIRNYVYETVNPKELAKVLDR